MIVTEEMNGGPLPYGKGKCPACLRKYASVLARGPQLPDGTFVCYAYSPQEKPKNPVCSFVFDPDRISIVKLEECESSIKLSANTVLNPLDFLFGEERAAKLQEMYEDGFAAW